MKDRVILLSSLTLVVTVALFAWFTWARWGTVGIYPIVGRIVMGAAVFALVFSGLFSLSRRRNARARQRLAPSCPPPFATAPAETCPEQAEKATVTAVEME